MLEIGRVHVVACILNFRRPDGLVATLGSLARQRLASDVWLSVVVVDNNPVAQAEALLAGCLPEFPYPLTVCHQPVPGIARSRNQALEIALEKGADFLAFIDDDEVAEENWLQELLAVQHRWDADVVSGPVVPRFTEPPPPWIVSGHYFKEKCWPDGTRLTGAATNNALLRAEVLQRIGIRFDERLGTAGGEDTVFFAELNAAAVVMRWAAGAKVEETIEAHRLSARWLWRRWMSYGRCELLLRRKLCPSRYLELVFAFTALRRLAYGSLVTVLVALLWPVSGKGLVVKRTKPVCRGIAMLLALCSLDVGEDKRADPGSIFQLVKRLFRRQN